MTLLTVKNVLLSVLCRQLGHGQFGEVYMAVATGIIPGEKETKVAVKVRQCIHSSDDGKLTLFTG